jgi:hypothetical protein
MRSEQDLSEKPAFSCLDKLCSLLGIGCSNVMTEIANHNIPHWEEVKLTTQASRSNKYLILAILGGAIAVSILLLKAIKLADGIK